jgi:hypothetical protein
MPENITPLPLGLEFCGKLSIISETSNTIAYKAYPCDWKFHGIVWFVYGKTWPSPRPLRDITGEPMENSRIFMDISMENSWNGGSIKFDS